MPAPIGNRYAVGNNGGQPPMYENPESLIVEVNEYFEYIKGEFHMETVKTVEEDDMGIERIKESKIKVWDRDPEPATITGLALFLGFNSRQSMYDYKKREEFSYIIKNATTRVEHEYEKSLQRDKPTGAIFALKNMGWADNTRVDHTTAGDKLNNVMKVEIVEPEED